MRLTGFVFLLDVFLLVILRMIPREQIINE
jgi:hypothetical protein